MFRGKFLAAKTSHKKLAAISSHKIRFDTECKFLFLRFIKKIKNSPKKAP